MPKWCNCSTIFNPAVPIHTFFVQLMKNLNYIYILFFLFTIYFYTSAPNVAFPHSLGKYPIHLQDTKSDPGFPVMSQLKNTYT